MLTTLKSFRKTYDLGWIDAVLMTLLVYAFVVSVFGAALNVSSRTWVDAIVSFMFVVVFVMLIAARSAVHRTTSEFRHFYRRGGFRVYSNGRWSTSTLKAVYRTAGATTVLGVGYLVGKHISASWSFAVWALLGILAALSCAFFLMAEYVEPDGQLAELDRYRDEGWGIINALNENHPDAYNDMRTRVLVQKFISLADETPYTPAGLESTINMTAHVVTALNLELKKVNGDA